MSDHHQPAALRFPAAVPGWSGSLWASRDWPMVAAEMLVLAVLAVAVTRLGWALVTPVGPVGTPVAPAVRPQVTAGGAAAFDPFFRSSGDGSASEVSTLDLALLGTRVDTVSGRGSAIIATPDDVQSSYLVGETVLPGVVLRSVAFDEVTLDRGGRLERLYLDQSSGGPVTIPAADTGAADVAADVAPGTRARLAADIIVTPRLQGGAITGYVLQPKGSGTAFAAAGLQSGDVLVRVEGSAVAGIADPATLVQRLDAGQVGIEVERAGRIVPLRVGGIR